MKKSAVYFFIIGNFDIFLVGDFDEKNHILIDNCSLKGYIKDTNEHYSARMCTCDKKGEKIESEN